MNSWIRVIVWGTVVLGLAVAGSAGAEEPRSSKKKPAEAAAKPATNAAAPKAAGAAGQPNGITQAMAKAGVNTCLARVDQVTNFLIGNSQAGAAMFVPSALANQSIVSTSIEIPQANGTIYASANFSPIGEKGCGATYDAVAYWAATCNDVATKAFTTMTPAGAIKQGIFILNGGANVRVFLMPAGQGCISIKKELVL